jgi:hypothetical protein
MFLMLKRRVGVMLKVDFNGGVSRHVRQIIFELVTSVPCMLRFLVKVIDYTSAL